MSEDTEVYEDLIIKSNYVLTSDMTVGNLTMSGGYKIDLNGYVLKVTGDCNLYDGTICFNGGELNVTGNFKLKYTYIYMNNINDYLYIGGNAEMYYSKCYISSGIIELKGNLKTDGRFKTSGSNKVIFSGQVLQTVNVSDGGYFANVEVQNYSEQGIYIVYSFDCPNIITNDCVIEYADLGGERGYTLVDDVTVDGLFYLVYGTLNLNGHTMTINGDLIQGGGTVYVNGGKLIINGNYDVKTISKQGEELVYGNSDGKLIMNNVNDRVTIYGDYINRVSDNQTNELTDGIMDIKGNISIQNKIIGSGFKATNNHTIILSGNTKQNVYVCGETSYKANYYNYFAKLKIENTSELGVCFEQPVYVTKYISQNDKPFEGKTILDGYTVVENNIYNGDVYINGKLNNNLTVNGNVTILDSLTVYSASFIINGNLDGGRIIMDSKDGYVYISGNLNCYSAYFYSGKIDIKGNIGIVTTCTCYGAHRLNLCGDGLQTISNSANCAFNIVEINNHSNDGVYSDGVIKANEIITNGCRLKCEGVEGEFGWRLNEDTVYDGDLILLGDELNLNGHSLTVNGDLIQLAGDININSGTLTVNGNYIMRNRVLNGEEYAYSSCRAGLIMHNAADYVLVNGDFSCETIKDNKSNLTNGVFEVKGDFEVIKPYSNSDYFAGTYDHTFIFSGDRLQRLNLSYTMTASRVEINNTSQEGVKITGDLYATSYLNDYDSIIKGNICVGKNAQLADGIFSASMVIPSGGCTIREPLTVLGNLLIDDNLYLYSDLVVEGYCINSDSIDLYGNMTVKGNMTINGDSWYNVSALKFHHGSLEVYGNVTTSCDSIEMTNSDDYMHIHGDFTSYWDASNTLKDGTMEIGGNLYLYSGVYASGNSKIILSGDGLQTLNINRDITLNIVELKNYSDEGIYSPEIFSKKELIRNGCRIRYGNCDGIPGWTLDEDTVWDGDLIIVDDTLNLNGHTLTVNGNLIHMGGKIYINGGKLIINEDYRIQSVTKNGDNYVFGSGVGRLLMDKAEDYICVEGDMVVDITVSNKDEITAGTIELKKDLIIKTTNFRMNADSQIVMSGNDEQEISMYPDSQSLYLAGIKYNNISNKPIVIPEYLYLTGTIDMGEGSFNRKVYVDEGASFKNNYFNGNLVFVYYSIESTDTPVTIDGTVELKGRLNLYGDLIINGDFNNNRGYLDFYGGSLTVNGNYNGYNILMNNASDYLLVNGNASFVGDSIIINNGTIEITGNLNTNVYFRTKNNNRIILSGDKLQTVTLTNVDSINILELRNTSAEGVYSDKFLRCKELILNDSKLTIGSGNYVTGRKLTENTVISGDYLLGYGTLDLNGYTLTIEGDLIQAGGTIDVNGGTLNVNGSYHMRTRNQYGTGYSWEGSTGILIMDNAGDKVNIHGNMNLECFNESCYSSIVAGEISVGGDITCYNSRKFRTSQDCVLILNGTEKQHIKSSIYANNLYFYNSNEVVIDRSVEVTVGNILDSACNVTGEGKVCLYNLNNLSGGIYNGNLTVTKESKLYSNKTINGQLTLSGALYVNTYELTSDNLVLNNTLYVDEGRINCKKDFNLSSRGKLDMSKENGYVCVGGNIKFSGGIRSNLNAGTLEVRGDIVADSSSGFTAGGTHKTILAPKFTSTGREYIQTVKLNGNSDRFNTLVLKKKPESYVFSRNVEDMANEVIYDIQEVGKPEPIETIKVTAVDVSSVTIEYVPGNSNIIILGYYIYRNGKKIATTGSTTYTDIGLECATEYVYEVYPFDSYKNVTDSSPAVKAVTLADTEAPSVPQDLSVTGLSGSSVTIGWSPCTDNKSVTGYRIYKDGELIGETGTETSYKDVSASCETYSEYKVAAFDGAGNISECSTGISARASMPKITKTEPVDYTEFSNDQVTLSVYFKRYAPKECYTVNIEYYDYLTETWFYANNKPLRVSEYNSGLYYATMDWDVSVLKGSEYDVRFVVIDEDGNEASKKVTYYIDNNPPDAPEQLQGESKSGVINLKWSISSSGDCTGYNIYRRKADAGTEYEKITGVTGIYNNIYSDKTADIGVQYEYAVTAVDERGNESGKKESVRILCDEDTLAPIIESVTPEAGKINKNININVNASDNRKVSYINISIREEGKTEWLELAQLNAPNGSAIYNLNTSLYADGVYYICATAVDESGNVSDEFTRRYEIDNTGISKIVITDSKAGANYVQLMWEDVTENDFDYFQIEKKNSSGYESVGRESKMLGYVIENLNPDTTYYFRVVGYDKMGNRGVVSDEYMVRTKSDTIAPSITSIEPASSYYNNNIPLSMTVTDNSCVSYGTFYYSTDNVNFYKLDTIYSRSNSKTATYSYNMDITGFEEGSIYIKYEAYDKAGNKNNMLSDGGEIINEYIIDRTPPCKMENFTATSKDGYIMLTWDEPGDNDLAYYRIYRADEEDGLYSIIADRHTTINYYDTNVEPGKAYIYKAVPVDIAGNIGLESDASMSMATEDVTAPVINGIYPIDNSIVGVKLRLQAVAVDNSGLDRITVECRPQGEDIWVSVYDKKISGTNYYLTTELDFSELAVDKFEVRIQAADKSGNVSDYTYASYNRDDIPPTTGIKAEGCDFCIKLTFEKPKEKDASHFELYRRTVFPSGTKGEYRKLTNTNSLVYVDSDVEPYTDYQYKIRVYDIYGNYSEKESGLSHATDNDTEAPVAILPENIRIIQGVSIILDGCESRDNIRIDSYTWDMGNGDVLHGSRPEYKYEETGTYTLTLTVYDEAGNQSTATSMVEVIEPTGNGTIHLKITDDRGVPIPYAYVYVNDGEDVSMNYKTDGYGELTISGVEGEYEVAAYKTGYLPKDMTVIFNQYDVNEYVLSIPKGEIVVGDFQIHRMNMQEIIDAGVDISDPRNMNSCTFTATFKFKETPIPITVEYVNAGSSGGTSSGYWDVGGGGFGTDNFTFDHLTGDGKPAKGKMSYRVITVPKNNNDKEPEEQPVFVYVRTTQSVSWLKDMYMVELGVLNNADSNYVIEDSYATLNLPEGISLAITSAGQTLTNYMGDIWGQDKVYTSWVIKGDKPGDYTISADFTGVLQPFECPVNAHFETSQTIDISDYSGLVIDIMPESIGYAANQYFVQFKITNNTGRPLYNFTTSIGPYVDPGVEYVRYVYDPESNKMVFDEENSYRGKTHVYSELSTCDQTLVMMGNDKIKIPTLSEGMSIYGTYSQLFPGDNPNAYYELVDSMVEVIQGSDLNVTINVKPIASHITKQFVQYVERESMYGDPVDVTTGAYMDEHEALSLKGDAILSLDLSYNSATADVSGEAGYGWYHNFESSIVEENGIIHYYMAPAYCAAFVNQDSLDGKIYGSYKYGEYILSDHVYGDTITYRSISPFMAGYVLVKNADGTYTMTTPAGYIYTYGADGKLAGMVLEDGSSVTLTRTANQVIVTEDVSGKRIKLDYAGGMLASVSDDSGRITRFMYTDGYLTEIINPVGEHIYYSYDEGGRLTGAAGNSKEEFVSNVYDHKGRVVYQRDGYGNEITFEYTETDSGMVTVATNPDGNATTIVSDRMCNILKVVNEEGVETNYTYDSNGNMLTSTDTYGNIYTYTYDENGNVTSYSGTNGESISIAYNEDGYITDMSAAGGNTISYRYDEDNRVIQVGEDDIIIDYSYDDLGRMISVAGPEGRITSYGYEGVSDLPVTMTDAEGNVITMEYDSRGNLIKVTDACGNPTMYSYDSMNRIVKLIHPNGGTISYTYDEYGNISSVTDALGYSSYFIYDIQGRMTAIVYADGSRESFEYDAMGNVTVRTAPDGRKIRYEYDAGGNPVKETYPDGTCKTYTYDLSGRLASSTDISGNVTEYTYDGSGEIASILKSDGNVVTPIYGTGTSQNRITGIDYGDGTTATGTWDNRGNLTGITDTMGNVSSYSYNVYGEITESIDANGNKTTYSYDKTGKCIRLTYPDGTAVDTAYDPAGRPVSISTGVTDIITGEKRTVSVSYTYDCMGNVSSFTDEQGSCTYYGYDLMNRLTKVTDSKGNVLAEYSYDCLGRVLQEKTSDGILTTYTYNVSSQVEKMSLVTAAGEEKIYSYTYDTMGRILTVTDPSGVTTGQSYDMAGNLSEIVYPKGGGISYTYDRYGRLTGETLSTGTAYTYGYNRNGMLSSYTNGRGQETVYSYERSSRMTSYKDELGTVSYTYDANGNVLTVTETDSLGNSKTITRTYDCMNRVLSCTDYRGNTVRYGYDELGNIVSLTYAGGEIVRYSYYDNGLLAAVVDGEGYRTSYTYDSSGRESSVTKPDGTIETKTYNDRGWLETATVQAKAAADADGYITLYSYTYTYDDWGNITGINCEGPESGEKDNSVLTSATMTYDDSNRMITFNGEEILYDDDGNMVYGPLDGEMTEFEYDCRNRLICAGDTYYEYDAEDVRTAVETPEYRDEYVTDRVSALSRVLSVERTYKGSVGDNNSSSGTSGETVTTTYYYGRGLLYEKNGRYGLLVYHYDHLGSTRAVTDRDGNIVSSYSYGTYGELLTSEYSGKTVGYTLSGENSSEPVIRFLYNGELGVVTDDNGLYYMRSRYYNPEIKRFINQDILTGNIGNNKSLNRYSYVQGNPVSYTDPFGLSPFSYLSEPIHSVLSMAGAIPVIGTGFDIMNSAIYLMEGEKNKAALNLVCLIPGEKAIKYIAKNGKKIAAVSAATAIFCQTDAGAGLKSDLIELKDDAVEFYGLDNLNAMDYLIIAVAGANVINGGRASRLDIDLPNKRIPDAELAGTGVRLDIDSFDDAISNKNNAWNNFWNDNRGCVDFDGFSNKTSYGKSSSDFDYYMDLANKLDVSTPRNGAAFYSGPGNRARATDFANQNRKFTLETTVGGKYLDSLNLYDKLPKEQADMIWKRMSERYAQGATGNVYGFVNGSNAGSIFNTVEYPTLLQNKNVTNIFTEIFN